MVGGLEGLPVATIVEGDESTHRRVGDGGGRPHILVGNVCRIHAVHLNTHTHTHTHTH